MAKLRVDVTVVEAGNKKSMPTTFSCSSGRELIQGTLCNKKEIQVTLFVPVVSVCGCVYVTN
jgi:hypothetical protein